MNEVSQVGKPQCFYSEEGMLDWEARLALDASVVQALSLWLTDSGQNMHHTAFPDHRAR